MGMSRPKRKQRICTRRKHINPAIRERYELQSDQDDDQPDDPLAQCVRSAPTPQRNLPDTPGQGDCRCQTDEDEPSCVMAATKKQRRDKKDTKEARIDRVQADASKGRLATRELSSLARMFIIVVVPARHGV